MEHLTTYLHRPRTTRSPLSFWGDGGIELRDRPKDAFGIQGSRTDHRTLFNKWNALAVCSQVGQAQYDESCKLCSGGSYCLSSASMVESVGGPRGGGLPCGGCQRFESAYLQLVSLVGTKLYDSTQFFRFGSSIYDLSFMDVDKILPFSSTLGWHSLKVKGEVQTRKGLRWIPRHPETRKGVVSDEMLRGVENKRRSGDSRIGQPFKLLPNPWAGKRQPGELKHLSNQRKRKQKRFP
ncbi:Vacuolar protein sorting-associated protein [Salix suchowensis]|nr:Vacuolar protein sorting-associated protein [Salix suchowensis]